MGVKIEDRNEEEMSIYIKRRFPWWHEIGIKDSGNSTRPILWNGIRGWGTQEGVVYSRDLRECALVMGI